MKNNQTSLPISNSTKIAELLLQKNPAFSFEVFPPRPTDVNALTDVYATIANLKEARPDFISVTFGAGGSNRGRTIEVAAFVEKAGSIGLAHLTAVGYSRAEAKRTLDAMYESGIRNILALRGDAPKNQSSDEIWKDFSCAKDFISFIKEDGRFCIGAACYPEGHVDNKDIRLNIRHACEKQDAGVDFFVSQLFFDNSCYYRFMDDSSRAGLSIPVIPGIMPVLNAAQIGRMIELSGAWLPPALKRLLDRWHKSPVDMQKAGIDYATMQVNDLIENGAPGIHLYTMNKAYAVLKILDGTAAFKKRR